MILLQKTLKSFKLLYKELLNLSVNNSSGNYVMSLIMKKERENGFVWLKLYDASSIKNEAPPLKFF